jgi:hypothetical protein
MEHIVSTTQVMLFLYLYCVNSASDFRKNSYRFGFEFDGGIVQLSSTIETKNMLILPPGSVTILVYVCDVISSCTKYEVARIIVRPVIFSLASSNDFSVNVGKFIQSGQVEKFLLSVFSAAKAITAQSSSQIRNRHLTQVFDL